LIAPGDAQSPLHGLLEQHGGEGAIGPIVWEVDDIDAIRAHAQRRGIGIMYELVNSNGGRQICLSSADCLGYTATFIEKPLGPPAPRPDSSARFKRLNRVELLLPAEDLEAARTFFSDLLDVHIDPPAYQCDNHVLSTICWEAGLELFGPGDKESPLNKLLEQKGRRGAIGPIVWEVTNVDHMKEAALAQGHQIVYEFARDNRRQIYLGANTLFGYTAAFTQLKR
jgi:hypothetical protein